MENAKDDSRLWLKWLVAVVTWLLCAALCLLFTVEIEIYPLAYDTLFPAILLILFGNIFVFLFIVNRWGALFSRLLGACARICIGEALLLAVLYGVARYGFGA